MDSRAAAISSLPNVPSVYALYGGSSSRRYVAYVGIATRLKERITQHMIRRDSSVTTGVTAVSLNPDLVTELRWWDHPDFEDKSAREAAELVAFDVLDPSMRSRGNITEGAKALCADESFRGRMAEVFRGEPAGAVHFPTLDDVIAELADLRKRVEALEK